MPSFGVADDMADRIVRLLLAEAVDSAHSMGLVGETLARALVIHLLRRHSNVGARTPETPAVISGARFRRAVPARRRVHAGAHG